jgi:LemA protein
MTVGLLTFLLMIALPLVGAAVVYNRLVGLRNAWRNAFAQIDVQLKRRHDLVPGLVEVARAYLEHERRTLESVVAARQGAASARASAAARWADPQAMAKLDLAEVELRRAQQRASELTALADAKADAARVADRRAAEVCCVAPSAPPPSCLPQRALPSSSPPHPLCAGSA